MNPAVMNSAAAINPAVTSSPALTDAPPVGSPAWIDQRRRAGIGASESAAALGASRFTSRMELWLDKRGMLPPKPDTERMRWGRWLEGPILDAYEERVGIRVERPKSMLRSAKHSFMFANLDAIRPGCVVEAKNMFSRQGWGASGSDEMPLYIRLQVEHQMIVAEVERADVVVLFQGCELDVFHAERDAELSDVLVEGLADFWQLVETQTPPPVESYEDAQARWGRAEATGQAVASEHDLMLVQQLRDLMRLEKAVEEEERGLKAALMQSLGESADTLVDPEGLPILTWKKPAAPQRFDQDAFAAAHPVLFRQFLKPGTAARRFLMKKPATM